MMVRRSLWVASVLLFACSVDGDDGSSFGVPGPGTNPGSSPGSADDGSGGSDTGTASGESTAAGSDDATGSSGGNPVSDSSGGAMTTDMPGDESSTGMMPPGMGQPADGMYSDCLDAMTDCAAPTNVCFVINDNDGFCTNMACANPATDCDAAPGGTATPICFPVELGGMPSMSCALSCTGGLMCPVGMTCYNLTEGGICA
jgi:hypothetical protein